MLNNTVLVNKALVVTCVLSVIGLGLESMKYAELDKKARAEQYSYDTSTYVVDLARQEYLLRRINEGKLEEAKSFLSSAIASNAKEIKSRVSQSDDVTRIGWELQQSHLLAEARQHPDFFEPACRKEIMGSTGGVFQVAQH